MLKRLYPLTTILLVSTAISCAESGIPSLTAPDAVIGGPDCQVGCVEEDPDPSAPGVFLGSGVTPWICASGSQTDGDQDGLSTFCENQLAAAFAPELYYWNADNVGREPHWVAQWDGEEHVLIGYLLSFYRDEGSDAWVCGLPFAHWSCNGHNGDSEAIFLRVYYDEASDHWVLADALYSQHGDLHLYWSGSNSYPTQLVYPSHPGAYPRAYVSQGKHANYSTRGECNSGGAFNTDTCVEVNTAARFVAWSTLNLGSRGTHSSSQDCMPSSNPSYEYYGSGRLECYWTTQNFRGWIPTTVGGAEAGPYNPLLQSMGF